MDTLLPRVLLLTQDFPPRPGGMGRYYADLATGWGTGFTVMCGTWNGQAPVARGSESVLTLDGVDARGAHRPSAVWRATRQLQQQVRTERPAILLAGNIRPYAPVIHRASRTARIPWGFFAHGKDLLRTAYRWRGHALKRWRWRLLERAPLIVTNSRFTAGEAARLGLAEERMAIVPPEVDTAHFRPARDRAEVLAERQRLGLPLEGLLTLFVGRMVERKGLADLFAALMLTPAARLVVIGAGDAEPWKRRAQAAGAGERVTFGGSPSDLELPHWYRAADIFASPCRHQPEDGEVEGFGIVFLEAQACGLPVLATRAGGIPEAVDEDRTALLVPPGDIAALAAAWRRLHADDALRTALGQAAVQGPPRRHGPGSSARLLAQALEKHIPLGVR